ncbi:MAG TPA: PRC-barrel domain-containing protein [Gemmatimonadaceae bacterium]|nr:PRC-barrel domain-containing protein [Gemmatimonadaceae bacterium]
MAKQSTPRGLRDEASVGPDPRRTRHLVPLKELGKFKVADGDPDIRGWAAYTSTGREIGRVDELLVDTDTNEVVMLDIDLRREDRHTLAPLRAAWVDHAAHRVVVDVREVSAGDELPSLSRRAAMTDEELRRFDEDYERAYGQYHDDRELRLRDRDGELRFGRRADDRADDRAREAAEAREAERREAREQAEAEAADAAATTPRRSRFVERREVEDAERYRVADVGEREIRVPRRDEEVVVERRPIVEEVVVRRREADEALGRRATDAEERRDR